MICRSIGLSNAADVTSPQHWCSGFESALSSVLIANREAEASSSQQLQAEIETRDAAITDLSQQIEKLRTANADLTSQLAASAGSSKHAIAAAEEQARQARGFILEAEQRCHMLEAKLQEQNKRHEEYAGFIAEVRARSLMSRSAAMRLRRRRLLQECSVKDDLIRDLEAERVVHSSALADLRSSTASLASTIEAVTRTLAPLVPGKLPPPHPSFANPS